MIWEARRKRAKGGNTSMRFRKSERKQKISAQHYFLFLDLVYLGVRHIFYIPG